MIYAAAGRLGLSRGEMRELTWRQLDLMDRARRVLLWDLIADLKAFVAASKGVTIDAAALNPERSQGLKRGEKFKPSEIGITGHVTRRSD
jgi:hypothetical protein